MYHKKNNKKRLSAIIAAAVAAVTLATAGGTVAFLVDKTGEVKNTFTPSKVACSVQETFNKAEKTDVSIKNTGDTDAFIRATIVVTWRDKDGDVYGVPIESSDYTITPALPSNGWFKGSDGYYYYSKEVAAGASTAELFDSCKLAANVTPPEGCTLAVEILADAIQSRPEDAVEEAWKVVEATVTETSATIAKKN